MTLFLKDLRRCLRPLAAKRLAIPRLSAVGRAARDLRTPRPAADDWSGPWSAGCGCELCGSLGAFLAGPAERTLEWPLAEARRKHVADQIKAAEFPVKHQVWKFGSPYTLVLTKTDDLFRREAKARENATSSLAWLADRPSSNQSARTMRQLASQKAVMALCARGRRVFASTGGVLPGSRLGRHVRGSRACAALRFGSERGRGRSTKLAGSS